MNRNLLALAAFSPLGLGCSHALHPSPKLEARSAASSSVAPGAHASLASEEVASRRAGDFVVYHFSGSFHNGPLTLTERVLEASGPMLLVDLTLKGGKNDGTLRVRFDTTPGAKTDVVSVARVEGASEKASSVAAYEAFMTETIFAADQNDDLLGTESVKVTVGDKTLECLKTSYAVTVGRKKGTLSTIASKSFAWGDVGGELKTSDGKLMYRVEVVDAGHENNALARTP